MKQLDISAFIRNLPNGKDTVCFSTEDASGSTSQAANTVEAVLSGSRTLLIDEDTSATNFMVRDALMQHVIHPEQEPIIPFLSRMRQLQRGYNQSELIARGLAREFGRPVEKLLRRRGIRQSQTQLGSEERQANAQGIYSAAIPTQQRGKHLLLVDDVMTTGATLTACATALLESDPTARISVFTLACAN